MQHWRYREDHGNTSVEQNKAVETGGDRGESKVVMNLSGSKTAHDKAVKK